MPTLFADTFYFIALLDSSDPAHPRAVAWSRQKGHSFITTEYILIEFADAFHAPGQRHEFAVFQDALRADPNGASSPPTAVSTAPVSIYSAAVATNTGSSPTASPSPSCTASASAMPSPAITTSPRPASTPFWPRRPSERQMADKTTGGSLRHQSSWRVLMASRQIRMKVEHCAGPLAAPRGACQEKQHLMDAADLRTPAPRTIIFKGREG